MTELERLLAASLKRLDDEHAASARLSASVSQLNGRVDALPIDYQQLVGEYEKLASATCGSKST